MKKFISVLLVIALLVPMLCVDVFAEDHPVNDFARLKQAIESAADGDTITVNDDITITQTLMITKNITIKSDGAKTLTAGPLKMNSIEECNMFYISNDKELSLENITLDGNNGARLIRAKGAKLNLTNVIMKNGSTGNLQTVDKNGKDDQNYSGGAILAEEGSTVTIKGGSFENNNTGTKPLNGDRAAEGGAIKIDSSKLAIDGTTFKGNHLDGSEATGGRQGGSIEATNTTATISNATFDIVGPFNTGGAIKFESCSQATVTGSTFTIAESKGQFGVAGGAITSEGSNLTIEKSNFKAGKDTRVAEAGGLIEIVGTGSFDLINSTLEGSGAWFNGGKDGLFTANTGGAISFYDDCEMKANITGTTIKNFMADGNGAGIALSKGNGHSSKVNLTLTNTTIENAAAYTFSNSYAGGLYIGEGNTVKIEGGKISNPTASLVVSGIYNMGDLEITGGAQITGNLAYKMVGGIYNDGKLKIDDATISNNNVGDWSTGDKHILDKTELGGKNIYADKDVIITSKAKFDGIDVRVLDQTSAILLAGSPNKINVSISEKPKTTNDTNPLVKMFAESQKRKVGYVVAKGTEGYEATAEDAKKLHYVTNDTSQAVAGPDDHESTGTWDYVLNPKTKNIVLGQRVKVTLYANGTDEAKAKFENVKLGRNKDEGIFTKLIGDDKKEDIYDIYSEGEKSAILLPEPVREGYTFTGWYKEKAVNDDAPDENKEGKTQVKDLKLVKDANEITTIIDPHEHTLYAGWEKVIPVQKVWDDNNDEYGNRPDSVKVQLYLGDVKVGNPIELTAAKDWKGEFKNLPEGSTEGKVYSVKEVPEKILGYTAGVVTGDDKKGFTVTNTTEFINIEGKKTWIHTGNSGTLPTEVTVTLNENGQATDKVITGASWKFDNLPKYKNKTLVTYTLTENPVDNYTSTQDGYNFTNTYTNKFKVIHKFAAQGTTKDLPKDVTDLLPKDENLYEKGNEVRPTAVTKTSVSTDDGTWTFAKWDKDKDTIADKDVTFTGYWTFKEKTSDFSITKTVDKQTYEKAGDVLNYTVTVKNTGEKKLENLTITDSLVTITDNTFVLEVGEEKTFTYTYTISEADVTAKSVKNTASVTDGKTTKTSSTTSTLVEKKSDFSITKTVDKTTYEKAGDELTYTVTVKNTGEKDLTGLTISDDKTTFENPTFDLTKGASTTFEYTYTVTEQDVKNESIINKATVKHGEKEREAKATSTLITKKSDFSITKSVDKAYYEKAGEVLTYTVIVKNTGEKKLENLSISDTKVKLNEDPFTLDVNASKTFTYTYTISDADVRDREVINVASVTDGKTTIKDDAKSILKARRGEVYVRYETEDGKILDEFAVELGAPIDTYYYTEEKAFPGYRYIGLAPYSDPPEGRVIEGTLYVVYLYRERPGRTPDRRRDRYEREEKEEVEPITEAKRKPELNKKDHKQYMYGYPDWTFVPEANITRGEAAAMFARLFKEYPGLDYDFKKYYTDVERTYWGFKEISYLSEFGILSGYSDGTFRPNNKITRAEFVKIAESFEALMWGLSPYKDVDGGHWAFRYIVSSAAKGWINGYLDGTFRPDSYITRAEAVTIVNRLLERHPDKDYIDTHKPELKPFTDLKPSYWAYYEIYEAVEGHFYNRGLRDADEHWWRLTDERFVFSLPRYNY